MDKYVSINNVIDNKMNRIDRELLDLTIRINTLSNHTNHDVSELKDRCEMLSNKVDELNEKVAKLENRCQNLWYCALMASVVAITAIVMAIMVNI